MGQRGWVNAGGLGLTRTLRPTYVRRMYFSLSVTDPAADPWFSWILGKNPASCFERDVSSQKGVRVVRAQFQPDGSYAGRVIHDPVPYLLDLRSRNERHYLDATLHGVCPQALRGLAKVFQSVLKDHNPSSDVLTEDERRRPRQLCAVLGPFAHGRTRAVSLFNEAGLFAELLDEGTTLAYTLRVTTRPDLAMSVTEFVQKLYLLAFCLSRRTATTMPSPVDDKWIASMVRMCAGWLDRVPSRDAIVREVCGHRRKSVDGFQSQLREAASVSLDEAMSGLGQRYVRLMSDLLRAREGSAADRLDDEEESRRAEEMDQVWRSMSEAEQAQVDAVVGDSELDTAVDVEPTGHEPGLRDALPGEPRAADAPGDRTSLHALRHALILKLLGDVGLGGGDDAMPPFHVLDLGCASGELTAAIIRQFEHVHVVAVDADAQRVRRARRAAWRALAPRDDRRSGTKSRRVRVLHQNLLYLDLPQVDRGPDVAILSEVIEHFNEADRQALLKMVRDVVGPSYLVITVPNLDYNAQLGMPPGVLRHKDHKIEFTRETLQPVLDLLAIRYDVQVVDLVPGAEVQPSFVIRAKRRQDAPALRDTPAHVRYLFSPFHLPVSNYVVTEDELRVGSTTSTFVENERDVFYLGPTISPADFSPDRTETQPCLEHPESCFNYYERRGVTQLVEQVKYMGSRAYILAFRTPSEASAYGVSGPCVVNSRSGLPFFTGLDAVERVAEIYRVLQPRMREDVLVLDAEIMPWSIKARRLIDRHFLAAGETALLARRRTADSAGLYNAERFLTTLRGFAADGPLEVRPFHVLASQVGHDRWLGLYAPHVEHMARIEQIAGGCVQPCEWSMVDLTSTASRAASVTRWEAHCAAGGEGFVYKPAAGMIVRDASGYYRQPAIKVRGVDYLRLIYGIDYLEPAWFSRICKRNTTRKRVLAVQEQEIAERILTAFLNRSPARRTYVAAFLGVDDVQMRDVDRTL